MTEEGDHYYTVDEAARILELSPACVRQMLRAGELEGERHEERIEGVLGPWRIPKHPVHTLREGEPDVLRTKRREICDTDTTTVSLPSGEATSDTLSEDLLREVGMDTPSEASDLLSESVREIREKVEALREELGLLESRLEMMEIMESALREAYSGRRSGPTASVRGLRSCGTSSRRSGPADAGNRGSSGADCSGDVLSRPKCVFME
jgi:ribosomal protein S13